jgi:hypothetical protein
MTQADEYLFNKALGSEVNPKNLEIRQIPTASKQPRQWVFPDGSRMTETAYNTTDLIGLEDIK